MTNGTGPRVPSFHVVLGPDEHVWCGLDLGHSKIAVWFWVWFLAAFNMIGWIWLLQFSLQQPLQCYDVAEVKDEPTCTEN